MVLYRMTLLGGGHSIETTAFGQNEPWVRGFYRGVGFDDRSDHTLEECG